MFIQKGPSMSATQTDLNQQNVRRPMPQFAISHLSPSGAQQHGPKHKAVMMHDAADRRSFQNLQAGEGKITPADKLMIPDKSGLKGGSGKGSSSKEESSSSSSLSTHELIKIRDEQKALAQEYLNYARSTTDQEEKETYMSAYRNTMEIAKQYDDAVYKSAYKDVRQFR